MGVAVLDSSVLIGVLDASDVHHDAALAAVRRVLAARDDLLVPAAAYAELLVGAIRQSGASGVLTVDRMLVSLLALVVPLDREIAVAAAELRARHASLRLPDALVIATATVRPNARILTADRGWPAIKGLAIELVA